MQGRWAFALSHCLTHVYLGFCFLGLFLVNLFHLQFSFNFSARASNNFLSCLPRALVSLIGAFYELRALVTLTEGMTKSIKLNMFSGQVARVETAIFVPLP